MKLGGALVAGSLLVTSLASSAEAGGLYLPGSGATSTSRAGAAIASADDGEALSVNPAGLAKTSGLTITISTAFIRYFMEFTRRGTYDAPTDFTAPYAGQPYETITNDPDLALGIGKFQPIPVIAVVTDLGGRVPNLRLAAGLYAPTGYPFRDMTNGYQFPRGDDPNADLTTPPPGSRYDVLTAESRLLLPSIAASYRILPGLDVGARFTAGNLASKSQIAVWGSPINLEESVRQDSLFTADIKDSFIPAFGLGMTYRPTPRIELAAAYSSAFVIKAKGTGVSVKAPGVDPSRVVGPVPDDQAMCEVGGTFEAQRACINLQLPQTATLGARYKLLDRNGELRGDIEANVAWENWGKTCEVGPDGQFVDLECTSPGQYRVVIDSGIYVNDTFDRPLGKNYNNFGFQDTLSLRLGGSYHLPVGPAASKTKVIVRGGVAYDTSAAKTGWLRAYMDGADRVTTTLGGAYRTRSWEVNVGAGYVYEGTSTNPGASPDGSDCNPTSASVGCDGSGSERPPGERQGPDPTSPLFDPNLQPENPYNQGSFESSYVMFMLGFNTWF